MDRALDNIAESPATVLVSVKNDPSIAPPVGDGRLRMLAIDLHSGFHRGLWALQLDKAVTESRERVVFAAHGVACLAVAWWAQLSPRSYLRNVAGAVFHAPLALTMGQAAIARSLWPSPATRLPFPSIVAGDASPLVEQVLALADNWGSRFIAADAPDNRQRSDVRNLRTSVEDHLLDLLGLFRGSQEHPDLADKVVAAIGPGGIEAIR
jgi:hypothetical protein